MIAQLINGIVIGTVYALVALAYTLIFGFLHKLNLALGNIFMFGGFIGVFVLANGLPLWVSLIAAVVVGGLLGLLVELICFRKFKSQDAHITSALSTVAFGMIITDASQRIWGTEPIELQLPSRIYTTGFEVFGAKITYLQLAMLVIAFLLMIGLWLLVHRTSYGRFMRAIYENDLYPSLLGVNAKRVLQQTFFISSGLVSLTGLFLALRLATASSTIGITFGLKAMAVMAIGGMGKLHGALLVGFAIGIIEAMAVQLGMGSISDMLVWTFLIIMLIFKPSGLFGRNQEREARA